MTPDQLQMARALGRCTYPVGTWQKRYARWISTLAAEEPSRELSERQDAWLRWLVYRYRRQIPVEVVRLSLTNGAPPPHPRADEQRELERRKVEAHNEVLKRGGYLK